MPDIGKTLCLHDLAGRLDDLRLLCELERRTLAGHRLPVRDIISLNALRDAYPGSATRMRDELLMGEEDEDRLISFACEREDQDWPDHLRRDIESEIPIDTAKSRSNPRREGYTSRRPDEDGADDPAI